jgi:excisionase family DNA binding protein
LNVDKRLLSVDEAAAYLGLAPRTIYNAIAPKSRNPFPVRPVRIGKLRKFAEILFLLGPFESASSGSLIFGI